MATSNRYSIIREEQEPQETIKYIQNFILIWVDATINFSNDHDKKTLDHFRTIVNDIKVFQDENDCIQFLQRLSKEKVFVITSGTIGKDLVPKIHDFDIVDTIYIFCGNSAKQKLWADCWVKIRGVHVKVKPICDGLRLAVNYCNQDNIGLSFVQTSKDSTDRDLNRLEPSFMYTQLFKKIILRIKHEPHEYQYFAQFCRQRYKHNPVEMKNIQEFADTYCPNHAIQWYTRQCFVYQILNRALRLLESEIIVNMGFFIHDLHCQLEELHKQRSAENNEQPFVVYRGQGLAIENFNKLKGIGRGLIGFNSFLSTSRTRSVSMNFAEIGSKKIGMVGVLFVLTIDPKLATTPFADIDSKSVLKGEREVLFSMHTIFRLEKIQRFEDRNDLYQIELTLTDENDSELHALTIQMEEEFNSKGWDPLAKMLITVGQLKKAEELYLALLYQSIDDEERAHYYHQLGVVTHEQANYPQAIKFFEQSLQLYRTKLSSDHIDVATLYNNMALLYDKMGEHFQGLDCLKKALSIQEKLLTHDHIDLAVSYNNIGLILTNMGEYDEALINLRKSLDIYKEKLTENHPKVATIYCNISSAENHLGEYSTAKLDIEKAIEIQERTLPSDHAELGISYNNLGLVYSNLREYPTALDFYNKALNIFKCKLAADHPTLATLYSNMGLAYQRTTDFSNAVIYYEKALEIEDRRSPRNPDNLTNILKNIGMAYRCLGDYSKALPYLQRAVGIIQTNQPVNERERKQLVESIEFVRRKLE